MEERREEYKDNKIKTYEDLKEYFISNLEINYSEGEDLPNVADNYNAYRVWLLFVLDVDNKWMCVQVAHSKNGVKKEIEFVINNLYDEKYDLACELSNSQFYKEVCPIAKSGENYRTLLYHTIGKNNKKCRICILNVDKYLGIESVSSNNNDAERIVEICKNQYAEAKIAYQTLAKYWRKVSSAIDGQTIDYAVKHKEEFE